MSRDDRKTPVMLGSHRAMQRFRYEVARELGITLSSAEHAGMRLLPVDAIRGDVPKRMVNLAEQQMKHL